MMKTEFSGRGGLSKDVDGQWQVEQLYPHLQETVSPYPENFGGIRPDDDEDNSDEDNS